MAEGQTWAEARRQQRWCDGLGTKRGVIIHPVCGCQLSPCQGWFVIPDWSVSTYVVAPRLVECLLCGAVWDMYEERT